MHLDDKALNLRERLAYLATRIDAVLSALPALQVSPAPQYDEYATSSPAN